MRSSYGQEDVEILLKDITGQVIPQPAAEREKLIQSGRHYSEMLPLEYPPSAQYMDAYQQALRLFARPTAQAVGALADKIIQEKGPSVVLVSLARAGVPIGILLKRYIKWKYQVTVSHYAISIIRGCGIDKNAMDYILARHRPSELLFVDGWIGKGAIMRELEEDMMDFPGVAPQLAVLADPANITALCGTREDFLIPSACLNSIVSGLISRTFLRSDIIGPQDFHGAAYYQDLQDLDLSYEFIQAIEAHFQKKNEIRDITLPKKGLDEVIEISRAFQIADINFIKPGIGEATRVLLRRVPWRILISEQWQDDIALSHIRRLATEKQVPIEIYPLKNYKVCGIIRNLADA